MAKKGKDEGEPSPEVLPPEPDDKASDSEAKAIFALISSYTDRPDLLIAEIEKHDPGFIKRMNASAEAHSERIRKEKYNFGKRQAYVSLVVSVLAAVVVLFLLGVAIFKELGFWSIIGLVVFYAVSQGGYSGFTRIIKACSQAISSIRGGDRSN